MIRNQKKLTLLLGALIVVLAACDFGIDFFGKDDTLAVVEENPGNAAAPDSTDKPGTNTSAPGSNPGTNAVPDQKPEQESGSGGTTDVPGSGDSENPDSSTSDSGNNGGASGDGSDGDGKTEGEEPPTGSGSGDSSGIGDALQGGMNTPFPDSNKDIISYRIDGDSISAATALEAAGTYHWYLGTYTEQDFANLTDDTILDLYDKLLDDKEGKDVNLLTQGTGQFGLILLVIDGNQKISRKFFQQVVLGKTDRVFVHTHQHGPDSNPNYMYFALRVKGSSPKESFRMSVPGGYAYPRDLHFQIYANQIVTQTYINFNGVEVDDLCSQYGICVDGYSDKTGFANEEGTSFDFPFYFGYDDFRVAMSSSNTLKYEFEGFVVRDTTVKDTGIFGSGFGYPAFITMISSDRLTIEIPLNQAGKEYNPSIHKNIALLTLDFKDYSATGKAHPVITLDGFVSK